MPFPHALRALDHRDFRRFYVAQLVALVGGWMQTVAQAWLVLQLTDSPLQPRALSTLPVSPVLIFSLLAGAGAGPLPKPRPPVPTPATPARPAPLPGAPLPPGPGPV